MSFKQHLKKQVFVFNLNKILFCEKCLKLFERENLFYSTEIYLKHLENS